jgi:hypothetical protein
MKRAVLSLVAGLALAVGAQAQTFPSPDAAAQAFVDAVKRGDDGPWRALLPPPSEDDEEIRERFLEAWAESHKIVPDGDARAMIEVGTKGWTLPIPLVRDGTVWRFDLEAGRAEIKARAIGRNELSTVQTLLALVDAQLDYATLDPMKTGRVQYARRLLSSPGRKDGLYWPTAPGEPQSPIGPELANAQVASGIYNGYRYRLLYFQGPAAPGGAREYLINGRMLGFAIIAWPAEYGETGVSTFITSHDGVVYERDFGPDTQTQATNMTAFNPDKDWEKADMEP